MIKRNWNSGNPMFRVLMINIAAFLLIRLIIWLEVLPPLDFFNAIVVHSNVNEWFYNIWTVFTYQFVHIDFLHILFNMIMLYFFSGIFIHFLGSKRYIPTYIIGGLFGAILYVIAYNVAPPLRDYTFSTLHGASASVMAIAMAVVFYRPNFEVMLFGTFRVKLLWIGLAFIALDFVNISNGENIGGHISHLGGAFYGWLSTNNPNSRMNIANWFDRIWAKIKSAFKRKPKMKVSYKKENVQNDYDYMDRKKANQDKVDAILDKISKSGYDNLTKEEKEFLFKQSNEK